MIEIRLATAADVGALAELRWEFRSGRQPPVEDRGAFVARCAAWMRDALGSNWRAWLAVDEGNIVAQGTFAELQKSDDEFVVRFLKDSA